MAILKSKSGATYNTKTGAKTSGTSSSSSSSSTVKYDAYTGKALKAGESFTDKNTGQVYKAGAALNSDGTLKSSKQKVEMPDIPTDNIAPQAETPTIPDTAPKDAQVNPPNQTGVVPFEQASKLLAQGMKGSSTQQIQQATDAMRQKYYGGFQQTMSQGVPAPSSPGAAMSQMQGTMVPTEPNTILGGLMETDNNFDSIFTNLDKYMEPLEQKRSLVDEYKKLSRSLGIQDINEELVDARRIIDGTEDDIRAEVTATGGFATESQVMAMSSARNKSLIKNYNALLETRDNAMQQLNTMMQLTAQDRQAAEAEFDRKLNFAFKVQEFQQRATDNARQTYTTLGNQIGWDSLISNTTPYERSLVAKSMGISDQALVNMALKSQQDRQLAIQKEKDESYIRSLQAKKLKSEIAPKTGTISPYQQFQNQQILSNIDSLIPKITDKVTGRSAAIQKSLPEALQTNDYRNFEAALLPLRAQIFSQTLTAMREASKTGGAVGNVSDVEGKKLESALGALETGQSKEQFLTQLNNIKNSIQTWEQAMTGAGLVVDPNDSNNLIQITN